MNINLKSFYDISHNRTYNLGSVYVHRDWGGGTSLYRANHHHFWPNKTTLTPAQNREVRQAFADALRNESGLAPHLLEEIRARLGLSGAPIAEQPLERREIKAIFDMLEARGAIQVNFLSRNGEPSRARRMLDAAVAHLRHHADDFNGQGMSPFEHAMRNMAISRAYHGILGDIAQHPERKVADDDIRRRLVEEYERVGREFDAALSKHEPKDVYRHLAILGPKEDPGDLRRALAFLDELGERIPGLANMDDATATQAIYDRLCARRMEQPNPQFNTLTQTREIRRFFAADERTSVRERRVQRVLERLVDDLADRMVDILQNGNAAGTPESKDAVRRELGRNRREIRNTISGLFRNSPKALQLVGLIAAGEIDPAQVEVFKERLSRSLQANYAAKKTRSEKITSVFGEFVRVRSQRDRLIDAITINGKTVPARPAHPERIPEDLRAQVEVWCKTSAKKRERTLALVEALMSVVPDGDDEMLFALVSQLGLNGAQMSFSTAVFETKLLKDDMLIDPELMKPDLFIDVTTGGPVTSDNPADIRLDPETGRVSVSIVVSRGFKVQSLKGCDVVKNTALGAMSYFRIGMEIVPAAQKGGIPTTVVTSVEQVGEPEQ